MQMTVEEIIRNYTQAKDKSKQIGILADLNGCDKEKIRAILISKGCQMPTKGRPKKTSTSTKRTTSTKKKEPTSTEKYNATIEIEYDNDTKQTVEVTDIEAEELLGNTLNLLAFTPSQPLTLPDIVKNMIKDRLRDIEDEMLKLRLDKEELEDFLKQFADDV